MRAILLFSGMRVVVASVRTEQSVAEQSIQVRGYRSLLAELNMAVAGDEIIVPII